MRLRMFGGRRSDVGLGSRKFYQNREAQLKEISTPSKQTARNKTNVRLDTLFFQPQFGRNWKMVGRGSAVSFCAIDASI